MAFGVWMVYGGSEGQSKQKNWEVAKREFEISVAQDPGHLSGAPSGFLMICPSLIRSDLSNQ